MTECTKSIILRHFISLARAEEHDSRTFTPEMLERQFDEEKTHCTGITWEMAKSHLDAIIRHRGLSEEEIYDKGIVSIPSRLALRLISLEMQKRWSVEQLDATGYFTDGQFKPSRKHDVILPIRSNGLYTALRFFSIHEIAKWGKKHPQKNLPQNQRSAI